MDEVDAAQVRHHARVETLMKADHRTLAEMYARLEQNYTTPPAGWYTFGTHLDRNVGLEFWGSSEDGMPLWERQSTWTDMYARYAEAKPTSFLKN